MAIIAINVDITLVNSVKIFQEYVIFVLILNQQQPILCFTKLNLELEKDFLFVLKWQLVQKVYQQVIWEFVME